MRRLDLRSLDPQHLHHEKRDSEDGDDRNGHPDQDAGHDAAAMGAHHVLVRGDERHEHQQHRQDQAVDELGSEHHGHQVDAGDQHDRGGQHDDEREDALEAVVDSLFRQIVKNKNKLTKRMKSATFTPEFVEEMYEPDEYRVVKTKRFPVKPMEVEEAILQMNMLDHQFFVFRNAESGEINVVYKRHDGNYAVIEPEEE